MHCFFNKILIYLHLLSQFLILQDVVDPVIDEMLASFVVDSHFKSQPKGANKDDKSLNEPQDAAMAADNEVLTKILLFSHHLILGNLRLSLIYFLKGLWLVCRYFLKRC